MNSLIGSKFKMGHCILYSVVHGADVLEEPDASLFAVWFIRHKSVNSADLNKTTVEIYQITRRHSAKDSSL
jgi:hypothetical protein